MERIWQKYYSKDVPNEIDIHRYSSILDVFDESVRNFSGRPAFTNMGTSLTYRQLERLSENFASYLQQELKLKKGDRIAIQMPNLLQYPVAIFGALRAGLVIVNTNPLYTIHEMKHQFNDSGAKAIVILANFASQLQQVIGETKIEHVIVTEIGDLLGFPKSLIVNSVVRYVKKMVPKYSLPDAIPFTAALNRGSDLRFQKVDVGMEDIAFLQYTGGTTGVSKGAMLTHHNLVANMEQVGVYIQSIVTPGEEIAIAALPMYHIFCLTVHAMMLVKMGAENVLITNPRDFPAFIKELKKCKWTVFTGVNTLFNGLLNNEDFRKLDFSSVKLSVAGGMALQKSVAERWKQTTKSNIVEGYGLTETSPVATVNPVDGRDRVGTIGLPLPSTDVKLVDDNGKEVPLGQPGELCIAGPQVMKGYWQRPDETAKVMDKDGYMCTGDIAQMDSEGFLKIVDRKKDMILVSGFNVYPNEVEDAVASLPGVLECAALGIPDEHSGEVVKVFVVKKDPKLTAEDVIAHAQKTLTKYKVPRQVEFRTELPKTNVGKILRRALREPAQSR